MKLIHTVLLAAMTATPLLAQTPSPAATAATPTTESWNVDKSHSMAQFKVRHMMANVVGQFRDFDANISMDRANPAKSTVEFTIQATSIDTGNTNRDEHLRSADFFDVGKFPTISFKSTSIKAKAKDQYDVTGDLTMHGVTKSVTLPVTFLGFGKDGRGNEKGGFEIETTLDRKDFGVIWNRNLDEGGVLLGDDVKISINLEVGKKKP
jgi:polyisoprenoid-binding protein YceI